MRPTGGMRTTLAKLHRAGELTAVWVPDQAHEAIRDLVRARQAAVRTLRQARQQLSGFLLRHGPPPPPAGLDAVAPALAGKPQVRPGGTSYCAGRSYRGRRGSDGTARPTGDTYRSRVAGVVSRAVVEALQALRGVRLVAAATLAELGDITRFTNPRQSWRISAWCRPSIPAVARDARAAAGFAGTRWSGLSPHALYLLDNSEQKNPPLARDVPKLPEKMSSL